MRLTGPLFLWTMVVVTVGAFAAAVALWPRFAARGATRLLGRSAVLASVNVLVLLTTAVALNDTYLFYADWTDLMGALHARAPATATMAGATRPLQSRATLGPQAGPAPSDLPLPPGAGPGNRVVRLTVTCPASGVTGSVIVALPLSYFSATTRRYPVLMAFHGYPGGPDQWVDTMGLPAALDRAAAQRRIADPIVVVPSLEIPAGRDTECVNGGPGEPQLETWLTEDVPTWVVHHFRVRTDATSWATIGLSVGGWCAAMATMLHPDRFSAAVSFGGYFRPEFSSWVPFSRNSAAGQRYDLVRLAGQSPPPVAIWVETSHSDPVSYPSTKAFLAATRSPLSVHAVVLTHAGHRVSLWKAYLTTVADWLGATVPGFAPGAA